MPKNLRGPSSTGACGFVGQLSVEARAKEHGEAVQISESISSTRKATHMPACPKKTLICSNSGGKPLALAFQDNC